MQNCDDILAIRNEKSHAWRGLNYYFFFLCLFLRNLFFRLCLAILERFLFFPLGIFSHPLRFEIEFAFKCILTIKTACILI